MAEHPIGPPGGIGPPGPIGPKPASNITSIVASTGTFTETGEATVFQVQQLEVQASYTETGEPAALTPAITSAFGSFVETGEASLFTLDMVEAFGSFTETGEAASLTPGVGATYGAFPLTGEAALFQVGMVEAFGSFVETGEAAVLTPALLASYGSYTLTGEDMAFVVIPDITDTNNVQLPINCILAGQQLVKDRYRENNLFDPNVRSGTRKINGVSVQLDITGKFKKPSFTVTQNNRGYD